MPVVGLYPPTDSIYRRNVAAPDLARDIEFVKVDPNFQNLRLAIRLIMKNGEILALRPEPEYEIVVVWLIYRVNLRLRSIVLFGT